jgi:hypothetical protein
VLPSMSVKRKVTLLEALAEANVIAGMSCL